MPNERYQGQIVVYLLQSVVTLLWHETLYKTQQYCLVQMLNLQQKLKLEIMFCG
jgi:hypothetical protein